MELKDHQFYLLLFGSSAPSFKIWNWTQEDFCVLTILEWNAFIVVATELYVNSVSYLLSMFMNQSAIKRKIILKMEIHQNDSLFRN